jgi:hypothetical protein
VATFLSPEWFGQVGERLAAAPVPGPDVPSQSVTLVFEGGPTDGVNAVSLSLNAQGATVTAGETVNASVVLRLSFDDARALSSGTLESATALREGRIKARGDLASLTALGPWLQVVLGGAETAEQS